MKKKFWLRAEISGDSSKREHFYCDLIETDDGGIQVAKMRCTIWRTQLNAIRQKFRKAGLDLELENGKQVGIYCNLSFSPVYGLAINVLDADPAFAIGELELRRRELLLKLEKEHLFEPNKEISVPILSQRIGVITSKGSAACTDFVRTIEKSPFGFTVLLADATMQGQQAKQSICRAFDKLIELSPDVIVIIRGGGSKTDLSHLDNEAIARRIAESKVVVWTGIGHETDESVLDFVANQKFKTPTAVAVALVDKFETVENAISQATKRLRTAWSLRCAGQRQSIVRWKTGLRQGTRKMVEVTKSDLKRQMSDLKLLVSLRVSANRQYLVKAKSGISASAMNQINQQKHKLTHSRNSIETLVNKRLEFSGANLKRMRARFRVKRYMAVISVNATKLVKSRQRLAKDSTSVVESSVREFNQNRKAFRLSRYLSVIERARTSLKTKHQLVRAADPANNLRKGYSLIYDAENKIVTSVVGIEGNDRLTVRMSDGKVKTKVEEVEQS